MCIRDRFHAGGGGAASAAAAAASAALRRGRRRRRRSDLERRVQLGVGAAGGALESELHEHLHKRQAELHEQIEALGDAEEHAEEEGDRKKALAAQKEKLKSLKKEIARVGSEQDDGRDAAARAAEVAEELKSKLADAKKQAASEEKELDRLLSRKTMLQAKLDDYNAHKAKLGSLPMDAFDLSLIHI